MPRSNYICPRCGYQTVQKNSMKDHMYKRKRLCSPLKNDLDLDDFIKQSVLDNHIYHVPQHPNPSIINNQQINYYNQINNYVTKMDPLDKINKLISFKQLDLIGLDDHIESIYEKHIDKLDNDLYKEFFLDKTSILDIFDTVTCFTSPDTFNIIHDTTSNKLKLFHNGVWEPMVFEKGIATLLSKVQSCYLDTYELFLLRKACRGGSYQQQVIKEKLADYYKLLICFELTPVILQDDDNEHHETYYSIYKNIENDIKFSEVNRIKKTIYEIVRGNAKHNMLELNNQVMDLVKVDQEFKNMVMQNIQAFLSQSF